MTDRATATAGWTSSVLDDLESVRQIQDIWEELFDETVAPCPFVAPYWLLSWWSAFREPGWEPRVVTVWKDGELVAVLPTYLTGQARLGRGGRMLRLWEDPHSNRIFPLLHRDHAREAARRLVACMCDGPSMDWDVADLGSVPVPHPATDLLMAGLEEHGVRCGFAPTFQSPFLELPTTAAGLESNLSRSFRKTLRRKTNAAEKEALSYEFCSDDSRMDEVLALSEKTWQHANGTGIGSTPAVRTFYTNIAAESCSRGELEIALLREGGKPVAFELNLAAGRIVYNLKLGFDPDRADLSPGLLLRDAVLRRAIERGFTRFEFLGMAEPYKLHWTDTVRAHGNLVIARRGLAARARWWLKFDAKPWLMNHASWVIDAKRYLQRRLGSR